MLAKGLTGQGLVTLKEQSDTAQLRSHQFLLIPEREVEDEVREGEEGEKREREIPYVCIFLKKRIHVHALYMYMLHFYFFPIGAI